MMIPEDILKYLLCSECQQYLSVPPIKVYPNRQVKCGRCSKEEDGGVISQFYALVVKDFLFPCVNCFEGCEQALSQNEMKQHEDKCKGKEYECPFCSDFKGTTYSSDELYSSEFIVKLDKGNIHRTVWYTLDGYCLLFVFYNYDTMEKILSLSISVVGERNREHITQRFCVYDSENEVKLKTKTMPCSVYGFNCKKGFELNITLAPYIICRFEVNGLVGSVPKWIPLKHDLSVDCHILDDQNLPALFDPLAKSVTVKCLFKIDDIKKLKHLGDLYFKSWFYVNNLRWKLSLQRVIKYNKDYIGVYLETLDLENQSIPRLFRKFTLIGTEKSKSKSDEHTYGINYKWNKGEGTGPLLIEFQDIIDPSNGYIKNGSIRIDVFLKYEGSTENSCSNCHTCDKCDKTKLN